MPKYKLDEAELAQFEDRDEGELRLTIETNLLKKRAVVKDLKAYTDSSKEVVSRLDAEVEAALDVLEGRQQPKQAPLVAAPPPEVVRKPARGGGGGRARGKKGEEPMRQTG